MKDVYLKFQKRLLREKSITLRETIGLFFIGIICILTVIGFFWFYISHPENEAKKLGDLIGFLLVWLFSEISLLIYLFKYNNVPNFARFSILMLIVTSNMWFILYLLHRVFP